MNLKCGESPSNSSTAEASPCSGLGIPVLGFGTGEAKQIDRSRRTDADKATFDGIDASGLTNEEVRGYVGTLEGPVKGLTLSGPLSGTRQTTTRSSSNKMEMINRLCMEVPDTKASLKGTAIDILS